MVTITKGTKAVRISKNGDSFIAFYGINYSDEFQVLESKYYKTIDNAKKYALKVLGGN